MSGENIILSGTEESLKPIITLLIGIRQLIENRDIGDIVAMPLQERVLAEPQIVKVTIFFHPNKEPPFTFPQGGKQLRPYCNIPDIDVRKLSWKNIKEVAGGANGYNWGRFLATANLSNRRQMQIYAGSEKEAEERITDLVSLSKAKILTLSVTEEKKTGRRATNKLLYKETTRVYPIYFTVINNEKILVEAEREVRTKGVKGQLAGDFKRKTTKKIPLWVTQEPPNTKALIKEALRVRGSAKDDND
ncbi:hypothetical protein [Nostoc sp. CHAB 5715]|uniref:hypothetical protein n=1 Tax=Nostoc sp. CHAB 5715 TaxID=2780400 RepID=UPI001E2DB9D2|nr:hypothetical protein [Nostoc sp. CHAB 5715]MCC5620711.1 hypothetical protein [Nostoc sp. CHAB 5715]